MLISDTFDQRTQGSKMKKDVEVGREVQHS